MMFLMTQETKSSNVEGTMIFSNSGLLGGPRVV